MEGSIGIVSPEQEMLGRPECEFERSMQFQYPLAVVNAALDRGARSVTVNELHDRIINLDISPVFTTEDIFEIRRWCSSSIDCASFVGH